MKLAPLMAALIFTTSIATAQVQGIELDEPVPMPFFLLTDENGEEFPVQPATYNPLHLIMMKS